MTGPPPVALVLEGALYLLRSSPALLCVAVTLLALASASSRRRAIEVALFMLAMTTVAWLPLIGAEWALVPVLVLGVAVACGWTARRTGATLLVVISGGIACGLAAGVQFASGAETAGGVTAAGLLLACGRFAWAILPQVVWLKSAWTLGRRMAAAWSAAVATLLLVLFMRT